MVSLDVFENSTDAVLAADESGRVIMINRAACALLGIDRRKANGMACWQMARLFTDHGDPLCGPSCAIQQEVFRNRVATRGTGVLHSPGGERIALELFTIPLRPKSATRSACLHMLVPRAARPAPGEPPAKKPMMSKQLVAQILTARETEVLELLSQGRPTREIAEVLSVSVSTVRNHIEHIHAKLGVHRRIDAVLLWLSAP